MLDWEENLFLGIKAVYRRLVVRPRERLREQVAVRLREQRQSLLVLAQMISGRPLAVFGSEDRTLFRQDRVFLPEEFSVARSREANASLYRVKALVAALAIRDGWQRNGKSLGQLVARYHGEFPALAGTLERLARELPSETSLWDLMGMLPGDTRTAAGATGAAVPSPAENVGASQVTTEIEGKGSAEVTVLPARDDDGVGADMPMHTFEKVETVEEYAGQSRKSDDADELEEHAEGLSELGMTRVMRSADRPRSIYRSEVILDSLAFEVDDGPEAVGIPYPEWNYRRKSYRENWCHVREEMAREGAQDWAAATGVRHRALIRQLQRQFATLTSEWLRRRRQPFGEEFDVGAVVDAEVQRRTGHSPSEAIYVQRHRDLHDAAVLVLLDESYSTDAWIADRRVLDIIRESVFCVGEVFESAIESFAVAAFSSHTRRSCQFKTVKAFHEPWGSAKSRLSALEPRGYTRIGPALRHAQELLARERASRRMIVLLTTDGPVTMIGTRAFTGSRT